MNPWFKDKNILIISPGPSLKHFIEQISDELTKKFTIVAVAQAMPALAKYKVRPDFVIVVDPKDFSNVLDDWDDLTDVNLIAEESVHLSFLSRNFKETFTVVTRKDGMGLDLYFDLQPMDLEGGTVSLAACSLAYQLKAKTITLAGQDLSFSGANYFVAGTLDEKKFVERNNKVFLESMKTVNHELKAVFQEVIPVLGWNNENLLTSPEYAVYLSQFENFASNIKNTKLFNTSLGGANIKGFKNKLFSELLDELTNNGVVTELPIAINQLNKHAHQRFLNETRKAISDVLVPVRKAINILERKSRVQKAKLNKLDELEKKIIMISNKTAYISNVVSDAIIRLNRAVIYVTDLNENLELSLKFYRELNMSFSLYRKDLEHGLRIIERNNL